MLKVTLSWVWLSQLDIITQMGYTLKEPLFNVHRQIPKRPSRQRSKINRSFYQRRSSLESKAIQYNLPQVIYHFINLEVYGFREQFISQHKHSEESCLWQKLQYKLICPLRVLSVKPMQSRGTHGEHFNCCCSVWGHHVSIIYDNG